MPQEALQLSARADKENRSLNLVNPSSQLPKSPALCPHHSSKRCLETHIERPCSKLIKVCEVRLPNASSVRVELLRDTWWRGIPEAGLFGRPSLLNDSAKCYSLRMGARLNLRCCASYRFEVVHALRHLLADRFLGVADGSMSVHS